MNNAIELELSDNLKNNGFSRIALEANTLVVIYLGTHIRCDIENTWNKTIHGFQKYAKNLIQNKVTLQAVISFISENWLELQEKRMCEVNKRWEQLQSRPSRYLEGEQKQEPQNDLTSHDNDTEPKEKHNLLNLPPDTNLVEYAIQIIQRTVKGENHNIRLILYSGLSAYTFNPISVAIRAPTSEGKTHLVVRTTSFFPREDVMLIGSMSPKVLIRQIGELVDSNNIPLQARINKLKRKIRIAQFEEKENFKELRLRIKKKQKEFAGAELSGRPVIDLEPDTYEDSESGETLDELEDQLQQLYDKARYLINLHGKILIFLEPPHPELWNILKPILSHDNWEIEHPYVDTTLKTKNIVTQGWPVCIFCTAKDESRWDIWPEIQSRFMIISPNMSKEKYEDANILTFQKLGLPSYVQEQVVVSRQEIENTEMCILSLKDLIKRRLQMSTDNPQFEPVNPVWIPYEAYLGTSLPNSKGVEMRSAKYVGSLLQVVSLTKSNFVLAHCDGNESIARPEDLIETLQIIQDHLIGEYSGVPTHKIKFLEEIFYPCYDKKNSPDESSDGSKTESIVALTTRELADYYKQVRGRGINSNNLQKQFLDELVVNDLIGKTESEIDKRRQIYYPLTDRFDRENCNENTAETEKLKYEPNSLNINKHTILKLSKNYKEIPSDWLIIQILALANYRIRLHLITGPLADFLNQHEDFQFLDTNNYNSEDGKQSNLKRLTIREFIMKYESPNSVSILDIFEPHFRNFHSKIFGTMKEIDFNNNRQYGIFKDYQSYLNFLISIFELGMVEGTI